MNTKICHRFLTALAASLFSFYNLTLFSLMNVLAIYLMRDFHFNSANLGLISSCDLWGNVIGFIPFGMLIDRYRARRVGISLIAMTIAATVAMAYASNVWMFCALRFLQGLASAGSLLITMRLGSKLFPRHVNRTIGLMVLVALSGGIAGNNVYAHLSSWLGWQYGLQLIAVLGVICMLCMALFLHDEHEINNADSPKPKLVNLYSLLAGLQLGILNLPVILLGSLFGNQFLMQTSDITLKNAASISSLMFAGIMLGSPVFGYLADKLGYVKILNMGYIGLIVLTTALIDAHHLPTFWLAGIFLGIGIASCTQNLIYPLIRRSNQSLVSTAMGIAALVANAIGAIMQLTVGYVVQMITMQTPIFIYILLATFMLGLTSLQALFIINER